jgi:hypothetical protein
MALRETEAMRPTPIELTLDLARIEELFQAPPANPMSVRAVEILGQSGVDYLHTHYTRSWPRRNEAQLLIRLPAERAAEAADAADAADAPATAEFEQMTQETRAALRRYCHLRMEANRAARRLAVAEAERELLIALAVTIVAIVMLSLYITLEPGGVWAYAGGVATLMAVYAASLAIWDALESWFFDWTPFAVDNVVYRWISNLEVHVAPQSAQGTAIHE